MRRHARAPRLRRRDGRVDSYLAAAQVLVEVDPPMLRTITQRIFVAVREADNGLKESWGARRPQHPRLSRSPDRHRRLRECRPGGVRPALEVERAAQVGNRSALRRLQPSQPPGEHAGRSPGHGRARERQSGLRTDQSSGVQHHRRPHGRSAQARRCEAEPYTRERPRAHSGDDGAGVPAFDGRR